MNKPERLIVMLILICISLITLAQNQSNKFKMEGINPDSIAVNKTFTKSGEISPFDKNVNKIYGLAVSADIKLEHENSLVRVLLVDKDFNEYLVYEGHALLSSNTSYSVENICEETSVLDGVKAHSIIVEVIDATITLKNISYVSALGQGKNIAVLRKEIKKAQNEVKINTINKNLKAKGLKWVAGPTGVSELSYSERKKLYGKSTFPPGFEYYAGGVISTELGSTTPNLKSAAASQYVDVWDWRNRHGRNWITPVTNQGTCGSCWAFATTGAVEAMVNVYYNQLLHPDLSEQDMLSCSNAGTCDGGFPLTALDYIINTGIVDENTFPYEANDVLCSNKASKPSEQIKISGRVDFGYGDFTKSEDNLKKMLIEFGPLSGGLVNWSHAMVLVGYKVVEEGDVFYYRNLDLLRYWKTVNAGDPLIGKTVWIFKNSWGGGFGDEGYVYVETPITNMGWTHALKTPVTSLVNNYDVICEDRDGDGYYWWGLGEKPATCDCPDQADGNDADPTLGPLDEYGYCTPINATPLPDANFAADNTEINKDEAVAFTDLSTNNPTSWNWVFEGGNPATSTVKNPSVIYNTTGTYKVTLTATNTGGSDTKIIDNYIQVNEPVLIPVADFGANKTLANTGEIITFTDLSANNPTSWYWEFEGGDPATSTEKNPGVTYHSAGNFNVKLTVSNTAGDDTKTVENFIEVTEPISQPVADFSADQTQITTGETVTFTDLSANSPTFWNWEFEGGDPFTSSGQNPSVTYNTAGSFKVTLTATNAVGSDTKVSTGYIQVAEPAPVADFSADKTTISEGEAVNFEDKSSNNPVSWEWVFEGGNPVSSTERNPKVNYSNANTYKVSLTVSNAGGNHTKVVENYIQVDAVSGYCNSTGNATNEWISTVWMGDNLHISGAEGYGDFTSKVFEFEYGQDYNIQLVPGFNTRSKFEYWSVWIDFNGNMDFTDAGECVFTSAKSKSTVNGTITIPEGIETTTRMRVAMGRSVPTACGTLDLGEVEDYTVRISKPVPKPPVADFTANRFSVEVGESVQFSDLSLNDPTGWQWHFPGGTPERSTTQNPTVTYNTPGVYDVILIVTKPGFASSEMSQNGIITVNENKLADYCEPTAINSSNDYIQGISIGNIFNANSGADGYSLADGIINMVPGETYSVELVPHLSTTRNYWRIWIDFNNDGDFDDADETVVVINNKKGTVTSNIAIPQYATNSTRMRVSMKNNKEPLVCENNFIGETEDYTVSFEFKASSQNPMEDTESGFDLLHEFNVYPNPTSNYININLEDAEPEGIYTIFNINGGKMTSDIIQTNITKVDVTNYSTGVYFIEITNNNKIFRKKFLKR